MENFYFIKKKSTVVTQDYVVQLFTGTTTWTAPSTLVGTIKVLVVGSGGAGGGSGGGGGAAEAYYHSGYTVTPGNTYNVRVATGQTYTDGTSVKPGWASWFDDGAIVALGGGGGGIYGAVGGNGACGGGCGRDKVGAGGTGSKGFNGGAGVTASNGGAGGGGGMGSVGISGGTDNVSRTGQLSCGGSGVSYSSIFGTTDSNGYTIGDPNNPGWFCGGGGGYWQNDGNPSQAERDAGTKKPAYGGKGGGGFGVYKLNTAYSQEEKNGRRHTGSGGGSGGDGGCGVIVIKYTA